MKEERGKLKMRRLLFAIIVTIVGWWISTVKPEWTFPLAIGLVVIYALCVFSWVIVSCDYCKNCKKTYGFDEVSRELYKIRDTCKTIYEKEYNRFEERWETVPVKVDAVEITYKVVEKCRNCGYLKEHFEKIVE